MLKINKLISKIESEQTRVHENEVIEVLNTKYELKDIDYALKVKEKKFLVMAIVFTITAIFSFFNIPWGEISLTTFLELLSDFSFEGLFIFGLTFFFAAIASLSLGLLMVLVIFIMIIPTFSNYSITLKILNDFDSMMAKKSGFYKKMMDDKTKGKI